MAEPGAPRQADKEFVDARDRVRGLNTLVRSYVAAHVPCEAIRDLLGTYTADIKKLNQRRDPAGTEAQILLRIVAEQFEELKYLKADPKACIEKIRACEEWYTSNDSDDLILQRVQGLTGADMDGYKYEFGKVLEHARAGRPLEDFAHLTGAFAYPEMLALRAK